MSEEINIKKLLEEKRWLERIIEEIEDACNQRQKSSNYGVKEKNKLLKAWKNRVKEIKNIIDTEINSNCKIKTIEDVKEYIENKKNNSCYDVGLEDLSKVKWRYYGHHDYDFENDEELIKFVQNEEYYQILDNKVIEEGIE